MFVKLSARLGRELYGVGGTAVANGQVACAKELANVSGIVDFDGAVVGHRAGAAIAVAVEDAAADIAVDGAVIDDGITGVVAGDVTAAAIDGNAAGNGEYRRRGASALGVEVVGLEAPNTT